MYWILNALKGQGQAVLFAFPINKEVRRSTVSRFKLLSAVIGPKFDIQWTV